ncbi:MAG: Gfo/Idh/MocA family oxidoreductase [Oscillospiraceae bacterium]|nr:Gfo/Idh/MocA family oxidoreductase [Oscillospiraceae bacterium]
MRGIMKKLNVAILGQGRSGRDIHGAFLQTNAGKEKFNLAAVVEWDAQRREIARNEYGAGCDIYSDYRDLFSRKDIDLVINSTTSEQHAPITIDLLNHGFNVVCEKPASHSVAELDDMIATAKKNGKYMNIFQQSRFAPYFVKIKEILDSGVLGSLIEIDVQFGGFFRRWDWQTVLCFNAGNLYNTVPHPLDQVLSLINDYDHMPAVLSRLYNANGYGDAEDYAKLVLSFPGKPFVIVSASSSDPYPSYTYKIQGTRGGLKASQSQIQWKYFIGSEASEQKLTVLPLKKEDGTPKYCSENLNWHEESFSVDGSGAFTGAVQKYYEMTYDALVNGADTPIKPYQVRQQIAIYEEVRRQNPPDMKYAMSDFVRK